MFKNVHNTFQYSLWLHLVPLKEAPVLFKMHSNRLTHQCPVKKYPKSEPFSPG